MARQKTCEYCKKRFHPKRRDARFCSGICRQRVWHECNAEAMSFKRREYYKRNYEKIRVQHAEYWRLNYDRIMVRKRDASATPEQKARRREYVKRNRERILKRNREWR